MEKKKPRGPREKTIALNEKTKNDDDNDKNDDDHHHHYLYGYFQWNNKGFTYIQNFEEFLLFRLFDEMRNTKIQAKLLNIEW